MHEGLFIRAADLYRTLRRHTIAIDKPICSSLTAVARHYDATLLRTNRHCTLHIELIPGCDRLRSSCSCTPPIAFPTISQRYFSTAFNEPRYLHR